MSKINHQIQRIAERYKTYENDQELKDDLQILLAHLKEQEDIQPAKAVSIGELVKKRQQQLTDPLVYEQLVVKTGFEDFDSKFNGLLKGDLMIIGGRPGMGKTQFMVNLCTNIAAGGRACAFLSLELNAFQLSNRFIAHIAKFSQSALIEGRIEKEDHQTLQDALAKLETMPIYVHHQNLNSIYSLLELCNKLVTENKVEVIFIDYLQLIGAIGRRSSREAELAIIMRELKKAAKALDVCMVVTSQLSRQVENRPGFYKRPCLSDLRDSGAIEQDADKVVFIYRAEYYGLEFDQNDEPTRHVTELIMAKNNTGYLDTIKLMADPKFTGFTKYEGFFGDLNITDDRLNDVF
jgi:replicative DNA helicase